MRYVSPGPLPASTAWGAASGALRPAYQAGLPTAADTKLSIATRPYGALAVSATPSSLFERARRGPAKAARRAWSDMNDNAHVDRRAPPGRDPGGGGQRQPDRGI